MTQRFQLKFIGGALSIKLKIIQTKATTKSSNGNIEEIKQYKMCIKKIRQFETKNHLLDEIRE